VWSLSSCALSSCFLSLCALSRCTLTQLVRSQLVLSQILLSRVTTSSPPTRGWQTCSLQPACHLRASTSLRPDNPQLRPLPVLPPAPNRCVPLVLTGKTTNIGPPAACNSCKQPPVCGMHVHDMTWCRPCLDMAQSALLADECSTESSAEKTSNAGEPSSSEGEVEDKNDHQRLGSRGWTHSSSRPLGRVRDGASDELVPKNLTTPDSGRARPIRTRPLHAYTCASCLDRAVFRPRDGMAGPAPRSTTSLPAINAALTRHNI